MEAGDGDPGGVAPSDESPPREELLLAPRLPHPVPDRPPLGPSLAHRIAINSRLSSAPLLLLFASDRGSLPLSVVRHLYAPCGASHTHYAR